jgi:diguanylate cyclase (GGDEF)-like protein
MLGAIATTPPTGSELPMRKLVAAIWAGVGAFALLVTFEPVREAGTRVTETRALGILAAVIATVLLVAPARDIGDRAVGLLIALVTLEIGALSLAGGADRGDYLLLYLFPIVFCASFFSLPASAAHLGLVLGLVGAWLGLVDGVHASDLASLSTAALIPSLIAVWALVVALGQERIGRGNRLGHGLRDAETGLLSAHGFEQEIDAELSRAARHARPLALILIDVLGAAPAEADEDEVRRLAKTVARTVHGRIRGEDRAGRLAPLKFAVLAPDTNEGGAAAIAQGVSEQVRKRLLALGYAGSSFFVATGWASYLQDEVSKADLMSRADEALATATLRRERASAPASPPVPAAAAVSQLRHQS